MTQLIAIFFNVITPVFALVLIGYIAGPRLNLEARTLSRTAYFVLIPAFVFNTISTADFEAAVALQMVGFITAVYAVVSLLALIVGLLLRKSGEMISAYVMVAAFGNVGNFGLPLIEFHLGSAALLPATIYFLAVIVIAFVISVTAASWQKGGVLRSALAVLKTPALIALVPALLVNGANITPPLAVMRITQLLGAAMVPIMLVTLGVQLAGNSRIRFNRDTLIASSIRLLGGPLVAFALVGFFELSNVEQGAGILQASMPAAVLVSIIAIENDVLPEFVTTTVLFSTIVSVVTLTLLLAFV